MVREAKITERIDLEDDDHFIWIRLWEDNEARGEWSIEIGGNDQSSSSPTRFPRYGSRDLLFKRIVNAVRAEWERDRRGS